MSNSYEKAYTEVLEILKYLPKEEYEKIPEERIEFFKNNCAKDYSFKFDISKTLEEQKFLKETNSIIIILFRDYFATDKQKEKLQKILLENERKYQEKQKEIYNPDKLFEKPNTMKIENEAQNNKTANMQLIEVQNESKLRLIFEKIISWIKNLKK